METKAKAKFKEFVDSGYDVETVNVADIYSVIAEWTIHLVPLLGIGTYEEQQMRRHQWPFVIKHLVERLSLANFEQTRKIENMRQELIEAKKEVSRLKREKK